MFGILLLIWDLRPPPPPPLLPSPPSTLSALGPCVTPVVWTRLSLRTSSQTGPTVLVLKQRSSLLSAMQTRSSNRDGRRLRLNTLIYNQRARPPETTMNRRSAVTLLRFFT